MYLDAFQQVASANPDGCSHNVRENTAKTATRPRGCDVICLCFRLLFHDLKKQRGQERTTFRCHLDAIFKFKMLANKTLF